MRKSILAVIFLMVVAAVWLSACGNKFSLVETGTVNKNINVNMNNSVEENGFGVLDADASGNALKYALDQDTEAKTPISLRQQNSESDIQQVKPEEKPVVKPNDGQDSDAPPVNGGGGDDVDGTKISLKFDRIYDGGRPIYRGGSQALKLGDKVHIKAGPIDRVVTIVDRGGTKGLGWESGETVLKNAESTSSGKIALLMEKKYAGDRFEVVLTILS